MTNGLSTRSMPSSASTCAAYASSAWMFSRLVGEPATSARMVIGVVSPGANSVWSATYASRLSTPGG